MGARWGITEIRIKAAGPRRTAVVVVCGTPPEENTLKVGAPCGWRAARITFSQSIAKREESRNKSWRCLTTQMPLDTFTEIHMHRQQNANGG